MSTTQNTNTGWFNLHTEGLGFVSNVTTINGPQGPINVVEFTALEGRRDQPDRLAFQLVVACPIAWAALNQHKGSIEAGAAAMALLKLARVRAHAVNGEIVYRARLIKMRYLKIGDTVVFEEAKSARSEAPMQSRPQPPLQAVAPGVSAQSPAVVPKAEWPSVERVEEASFAPVVELKKDAPNYAARKAALQQQGYWWHSEKVAWALPWLTVAQEDLAYEQKVEQLLSLGYTFNPERGQWTLVFPARKNTRQDAGSHGRGKTYARAR